MSLINALIYLPPGHDITGHFALLCLRYIEANGYKLAGVVHTYADVLKAFNAGIAQVAVFARREHWDPTWTPRVEFVTHDACELGPEAAAAARRSRTNQGPGAATRRARIIP